MNRKSVVSSTIAAIGYDSENEILEVEFNNRSVYQYFDVPLYEYEGIMEADSHGGYLAKHIKDTYRYEKID